MMGTLMPRLPDSVAQRRFEFVQAEMSVGREPSDLVEVGFEEAVPNATGGQPVTTDDLAKWRERALERLEGCSTQTRKDRDQYTLAVGEAISETLPITSSDGAHAGVWSYLSLCVFPDVVARRWPATDGKLSPDRWVGSQVGRDRNYLMTAWRNWRIFGDLNRGSDQPLGEDERLNLLERTAVARNKRLVRAAAQQVLAHEASEGGRMEFTRALMSEVCRWTGSLALDVFSQEQLDSFVADIAHDIRGSRAPRRALS